jgi:hypothetical protein
MGLSAHTNYFWTGVYVIHDAERSCSIEIKTQKSKTRKSQKWEIAKSKVRNIKFRIGNPRKNHRESVGRNPQRKSAEDLVMFGR